MLLNILHDQVSDRRAATMIMDRKKIILWSMQWYIWIYMRINYILGERKSIVLWSSNMSAFNASDHLKPEEAAYALVNIVFVMLIC
jgi:hypothetical protein